VRVFVGARMRRGRCESRCEKIWEVLDITCATQPFTSINSAGPSRVALFMCANSGAVSAHLHKYREFVSPLDVRLQFSSAGLILKLCIHVFEASPEYLLAPLSVGEPATLKVAVTLVGSCCQS